MNEIWIVERSVDGGATWRPFYGPNYYMLGERAKKAAKSLNDSQVRKIWMFRAVAYQAASDLAALLAEFRKGYAWRLEGCADPNCPSCTDKRNFLARIDTALAAREEGQ